MRNTIRIAILFCLLPLSFSCTQKKDGAIEGSVTPPATGIRVSAVQGGASVAAADVNAQTGSFRIPLQAGTYELRIASPSAPYPLVLSSIVVAAGETTRIAPISLAPAKATGSLSGTVRVPGQTARVALLEEGRERAFLSASREGKYEFEGLPAGQYTVQVTAPGYAADSAVVTVADDRRTTQDIRMLYITVIEGVDWSSGKIRARGIGLPPKNAPTPSVRRELAKRAAIVDAERNMVRALELINVAPGQPLAQALGGNMTQTLSGYLQGYRMAAERDMDGGRLEIEIELPLTGPGGLSSLIGK